MKNEEAGKASNQREKKTNLLLVTSSLKIRPQSHVRFHLHLLTPPLFPLPLTLSLPPYLSPLPSLFVLLSVTPTRK